MLASSARGRREWAEGYLPGALWKDCERTRGRPDEVMSALKMSPLGHGGEPRTPTLWLATVKSKTRHMQELDGGAATCTHTNKTVHNYMQHRDSGKPIMQ